MSKSFECGNCGAPVGVKGPIYEATVPCQFCGNTVIVPEQLRHQRYAPPQPPRPPAFRFQPVPVFFPPQAKVSKGWLWLLILLPLFFILCVSSSIISSIIRTIPGNKRPASSSSKPAAGGGVTSRVALKFGSVGIGPGKFKDARSIAVDGRGRIYVGEYTGGRVQVFDAAGKFITQWSIGDSKTILRGLAADRKGNVYAVHGGGINRHDGETGELLEKLEYAGGRGFDDVTATPNGGLVAAWYLNRDDIVRFDSSGKAVRTIRAAISSASGSSELNMRVAADGQGNIYALGTFNNAVFKFSPEGKYISRFGSSGDQQGQFRAPSSIAVDGQGRIYVGDFKGIQVFDADGRYLQLIENDGYTHASGIVFDDEDALFIASRTQVVKLTIR